MKTRQVPYVAQLAIIGFCSVMIGLFIDDPDAQMLALLGVLFGTALGKNWIEWH